MQEWAFVKASPVYTGVPGSFDRLAGAIEGISRGSPREHHTGASLIGQLELEMAWARASLGTLCLNLFGRMDGATAGMGQRIVGHPMPESP